MAIGSTITLIQKWPEELTINLIILDEKFDNNWWIYNTDQGLIFTKLYQFEDFMITNHDISKGLAIVSPEILNKIKFLGFSDLDRACYPRS